MKYIYHVLVPILLGGLIYLSFRDKKLWMFDWANSLNLMPWIDTLRLMLKPYSIILPKWVLFSLPDAIWVYSMTCFFIFLWKYKLDVNSFFWITLASFLGLGAEIGQLIGVVQGTFDLVDLILTIIAILLASVQINSINNLYLKFFNIQ